MKKTNRILSIVFNMDTVQKILDEKKTVIRRVVKPANPFGNQYYQCYQGSGLWIDGYSEDDEPNGHIKDYSVDSCWYPKQYYIDTYAKYRPGDILYVKETWSKDAYRYMHRANYRKDEKFYRNGKEVQIKWNPPFSMPKEAARIWLKITDVRIERLQDITISEVIKEGCADLWIDEARPMKLIDVAGNKNEFIDIWNSTIKKSDKGKYSWDANPWVWVIEFERCEKPEEE